MYIDTNAPCNHYQPSYHDYQTLINRMLHSLRLHSPIAPCPFVSNEEAIFTRIRDPRFSMAGSFKFPHVSVYLGIWRNITSKYVCRWVKRTMSCFCCFYSSIAEKRKFPYVRVLLNQLYCHSPQPRIRSPVKGHSPEYSN